MDSNLFLGRDREGCKRERVVGERPRERDARQRERERSCDRERGMGGAEKSRVLGCFSANKTTSFSERVSLSRVPCVSAACSKVKINQDTSQACPTRIGLVSASDTCPIQVSDRFWSVRASYVDISIMLEEVVYYVKYL